MQIETIIKLDKFKPRDYQLPLCRAFESGKYKRLLAIWPRRAGKDVCVFNLLIRAALRKIGVYYYIFPTYSQARKVVWDSITNNGERFLDYIPKELITSTNSQEMKVYLANGSLIQLIGSDNVDSLMGTNPIGIIFSEYALQDPIAYQFLRPILLANGGWAMFVSTPSWQRQRSL
jgi:phage terminase large subunit